MKGLTIFLFLVLGALLLPNYMATSTTPPESQPHTSCNSCCQGPIGSQGTPGIPAVPGIPGGVGPKGERGESIKGDVGSGGLKGDIGGAGLKGGSGTIGIRGMPGKVGPIGITGPIGSKGVPGDSVKGEKGDAIKGDIGSRGLKGDSGSLGLKGEQGMVGLPGPEGIVGPVGPKGVPGYSIKGEVGIHGLKGGTGSIGPRGHRGSPGSQGVKGQKGDQGQSRLSAFSAVRINSFTPSSNGQALPFERVHTNVGDDFSATTGRFTCEIPGLYLFAYSIMTHTDTSGAYLMKNDVRINGVYRTDEDRHDMVSNTAVLQLAAGDQVWLKCWFSGRQIYSDSALYTSFSGSILHEM